MLRLFLLLILLGHGLIHFLGFAKGLGLTEINQLKQDISRPAAILWLLSALLFLGAAILVVSKIEAWWMPAFAGVLLSQILIFSTWQDARFGTIANVIILLVIGLSFAKWNFNRLASKEMQLRWDNAPAKEQIITSDELQKLPPMVQRWLGASEVEGKAFIQKALIRQQGEMKTAPDKDWVPFTAKQLFTSQKPEFLWIAHVEASPFMQFSGKDSYRDGKGHMLIKAYSLLPVVNQRGLEIDQGTMLRYLAESIWLPTNALNRHIKWREIDSLSAEAEMSYRGQTVTGIFTFSASGDPQGFEAQRYYLNDNGESELRPWLVEILPGSFRDFDGYRIPTKSKVSWKLPTGDYHWLNLEITDAQYNFAKAL